MLKPLHLNDYTNVVVIQSKTVNPSILTKSFTKGCFSSPTVFQTDQEELGKDVKQGRSQYESMLLVSNWSLESGLPRGCCITRPTNVRCVIFVIPAMCISIILNRVCKCPSMYLILEPIWRSVNVALITGSLIADTLSLNAEIEVYTPVKCRLLFQPNVFASRKLYTGLGKFKTVPLLRDSERWFSNPYRQLKCLFLEALYITTHMSYTRCSWSSRQFKCSMVSFGMIVVQLTKFIFCTVRYCWPHWSMDCALQMKTFAICRGKELEYRIITDTNMRNNLLITRIPLGQHHSVFECRRLCSERHQELWADQVLA